jgi:hypothetical protein
VSSTAAKRLERTVFYLDESIYSRVLFDRLVKLGARVERAGEAFPFGCPDRDWLAACGERGWVALTRDENIRRRRLERLTVRDSGVALFVFTAGAATASETANAVARHLHRFTHIAESDGRPFIRTFGLGSKIGRVKLLP